MGDNNKVKIDCKYGENCYRKNIEHLSKYNHSKCNNSDNNSKSTESSPTSNHKNKKLKVVYSSDDTDEDINEIQQNTGDRREIDDDEVIRSLTKQYNPSEFVADFSEKYELLLLQNEDKQLRKDPKEYIKHRFLVTMPEDFYSFWEWCKEKTNNQEPENLFAEFYLKLVGPFDVMAGKFNDVPIFEPAEYLRHYRFFYDPPEFQTIFLKSRTGIHYGYWRDDANTGPFFIARNDTNKGCKIDIIANNIFSAAIHFLRNDVDPQLVNIKFTSLLNELEMKSKKYENFDSSIKQRNKNVVCKTWHTAGLVVPYDKKTTVGYRCLQMAEKEMKKILSRLEISEDSVVEHLQPLITAANIAVDEGDFGNSIELGINLFCYGSTFLHEIILPLLINGYLMVKKPQFLAIIKSHLQKRNNNEVNILHKA